MLERDLVVSRTANGFMVRSLADTQSVSEDYANAFVFPDLDTLSNFLRDHFNNLDRLEKESEDDERNADDEAPSDYSTSFLPPSEGS